VKAIISDIHGNLHAFKAVLADIEAKGITDVICLGDVVGYGPNPRECLDLVKSCRFINMGNHEEAALDEAAASNFTARAREAIGWTRQMLFEDAAEEPAIREERRRFVKSFVVEKKEGDVKYVHGSPRHPIDEYMVPRDAENRDKMRANFQLVEGICFVGHTHMPGVFTPSAGYSSPEDIMDIFIFDQEKAIINVGSVGQPRDGDPKACYVTFDDLPGERAVVFRRVSYDIEAVVSRIKAISALDSLLAERLRVGK